MKTNILLLMSLMMIQTSAFCANLRKDNDLLLHSYNKERSAGAKCDDMAQVVRKPLKEEDFLTLLLGESADKIAFIKKSWNAPAGNLQSALSGMPEANMFNYIQTYGIGRKGKLSAIDFGFVKTKGINSRIGSNIPYIHYSIKF